MCRRPMSDFATDSASLLRGWGGYTRAMLAVGTLRSIAIGQMRDCSVRNKLAGILPCDGTFDLECYDWDQFLVAATYEPSCGAKVHRSIKALVSYLASRGGTWWSHCGGQYDVLPIANEFDKSGTPCSIDYPRSRVTRMVGGGLTLRDSYSLLPFSLESVALLAGTACPTMPWPCQCALHCAGYCRLTARMAGGDPDLDAYCAADCYTLYRGLDKIAEHAVTHGLSLKGTIGSSAWATAQSRLGIPNAELPQQISDDISAGDYGGRATIIRPNTRGPGAHWDISSAYPAALASCALPVGEPSALGHRDSTSAFARELPGIYRCRVAVPDMLVPPLPIRCGARVCYPIGRVTGAWALPELLAAMERGVTVEKVISSVTWKKTEVLFGPLMREWYAIRSKVGKKTPLGEWQRLFANSLTGKFAERPARATVRMHPPIDAIRVCLRTGRCSRGCTGSCGAWKQVDRWGAIWTQPYYRPAPSGHLQWAAYLKAHTRIAWLTEAERHDQDLVYGDTDSIWTTSRKIPVHHGADLGAWERKHDFTDWECVAIKCYRFTNPANDEDTIRASGAGRLTDAEWRAGRSEQSRGVYTLLEAAEAGRGLFRRKRRAWTLPGSGSDKKWYGDRKLGRGGITYPVTVKEQQERIRNARKTV